MTQNCGAPHPSGSTLQGTSADQRSQSADITVSSAIIRLLIARDNGGVAL